MDITCDILVYNLSMSTIPNVNYRPSILKDQLFMGKDCIVTIIMPVITPNTQ